MESNWYIHAKSISLDKVAAPILGPRPVIPTKSRNVVPTPAGTKGMSDILSKVVAHPNDMFQYIAQRINISTASLTASISANLMSLLTRQMPIMKDVLKVLNVDPQKIGPAQIQVIGKGLSQFAKTNRPKAQDVLLTLLGMTADGLVSQWTDESGSNEELRMGIQTGTEAVGSPGQPGA